jgi:DNA polymerase, archaea type
MDLDFQLLDCDYVMLNNNPIVRLFGKTVDGKTVCAFYDKFKPYFYILPKAEQTTKTIAELKENFPNDIISITEVDKFPSMGYHEHKSKMLKVTLHDPSRTPVVRDFIKDKTYVEEVFEADILFKYRFMADFGINGMKWIRAKGTPTKTNSVKVNRCISAESFETVEAIDNAPLKYMGIDIEVANEGAPDAKINPIIMISFSFYPAYKGKSTTIIVAKNSRSSHHDVFFFPNEKEMMNECARIFEDFDPDIIVGYNLNNFDIPYISERLRILKLPKTFGRCATKPIMTRKLGENKFRNSIAGRVIVDPYWMIKEMMKGGGLTKYFAGLKRFGLGDVSKFFLGEDKMDVAHSEISKLWGGSAEDVGRLIDYSRKDSELVLKLLLEKGFLNKYVGVSTVSGVLLQDALDSGITTQVEHLLLKEFNKDDYVVPCRPSDAQISKRENERLKEGLTGALVLDPKVGFHDKCVVYLDFASMYATIFISYNICPTTVIIDKTNEETLKTPIGVQFISPKKREGKIPQILKTLISERSKIKAEMKKEQDPSKKRALDAKQEALKRMGNSFYGYSGYMMARVYMLNIANAITSCGRNYIQKTKEIVESKTPYKVIYGDTDSVMIKTNTMDVDEAFKIGSELEQMINSSLDGHMKLKIEYVFKSLIILAKKRYAGWSFEKVNDTWKTEMVMKGIETVRRDWCDIVGETLNDVLNIILKEQNTKKAVTYLKDVVQQLQDGKIPIEKLVITKGVSKKLEDYKGIQPHVELVKKLRKRDAATAPGVGDRIGFVIVKGLQLMSDRAEDPDYVQQHGMKIDSKYYLENQIMPPLERVFEAIGVERSEIVGIGKQMLLTQPFKLDGNSSSVKTEPLASAEGLICNSCSRTYSNIPILGKCSSCNGELHFYSGENKSKYLNI